MKINIDLEADTVRKIEETAQLEGRSRKKQIEYIIVQSFNQMRDES